MRNGTVEPRIDDIALISALEQISGLMGAGPVKRQPVKHDIKTKAQAVLFTQRGHLVDCPFDEIHIGMKVEASIEELGGVKLPVFRRIG